MISWAAWAKASGDQLSVSCPTEFLEPPRTIPTGSRVYSVQWSPPNGATLVTGTDDKLVRLWDATSLKSLRLFKGHKAAVNSVAFSPDGTQIASGSASDFSGNGSLKIWDATSGQCLHTAFAYNDVSSVAYSPDGRYIATGILYIYSPVKIWDAASGQHLQTLARNKNLCGVRSVAFSPADQSHVASVHLDNSARVWDLATGECLYNLTAPNGRDYVVQSLTFSPDGRHIATGSGPSGLHADFALIRLWDAASGQCLRTLGQHSTGNITYVTSVAFSPDGSKLASGADDNTVRVWDLASGECLHTLTGHSHSVNSVAFSPCGRYIASASDDTTVKIWDAGPAQSSANSSSSQRNWKEVFV